MKSWLPTLLLVCAGAQAQTVWRCGAQGELYADTPCPGGRVVAVADPRSAAQVESARAVAVADARTAERLARERSEREAEARRQGSGLTGIRSPEPPPKVNAVSWNPPRPKAGAKHRPRSGGGTSPRADRGSRRAPD